MIFLLEEKMCRAEVFCTEQQHSMAEAGGEKFPLVFAFVGENESAAGGPGCVGLFIPNGAFPGD